MGWLTCLSSNKQQVFFKGIQTVHDTDRQPEQRTFPVGRQNLIWCCIWEVGVGWPAALATAAGYVPKSELPVAVASCVRGCCGGGGVR